MKPHVFHRQASARPYRQAPAAFSLMELLVVLGVMAVLYLLILMGAGYLRGRGQSITCLANLRQIHAAMVAYAADHRGFFPKAHFIDDEKSEHWIAALQNGGYTPRYNSRAPQGSIHFCPAMNKPAGNFGRHSPHTANYGANRSILGYFDSNGRNDPATPLARINNPSSKLLLFEYGSTYAFRLTISNFTAPNYIPGHKENANRSWSETYRRDAVEGRHGRTINLIHVDGSAATVTPEAFLEIPPSAWVP